MDHRAEERPLWRLLFRGGALLRGLGVTPELSCGAADKRALGRDAQATTVYRGAGSVRRGAVEQDGRVFASRGATADHLVEARPRDSQRRPRLGAVFRIGPGAGDVDDLFRAVACT